MLDVGAFVEALRAVADGETVIDPEVVDHGLAARRTPLQRLTEREHDVLRELARGQSNAAIAATLFLSEWTVEAHLRSIFLKLDLAPDTDSNRRVRAALAGLVLLLLTGGWLAVHHYTSTRGARRRRALLTGSPQVAVEPD